MLLILKCQFIASLLLLLQRKNVVTADNSTGWIQKGAVNILTANGRSMQKVYYLQNSSDHGSHSTEGKRKWKEEYVDLETGHTFILTPDIYNYVANKIDNSTWKIYNITVNERVVSNKYAIMHYEDFRKETEQIFLPFPVKYISHIMFFSPDYPEYIDKREAVRSTQIEMPIFQQFISDEKDEKSRATALFYNMIFLLQLSGDQQLCMIETWRQIGVDVKTRRPWLGTCCGVALHDIRLRKDYEVITQNVHEKIEINFECHEPDILRDNTIIIAKLISIIVTLLSPLFLRLIPTQPWRHRHIIPLRKTCSDGHDERHIQMEANHVHCTNEEYCDAEEIVCNRDVNEEKTDTENRMKNIEYKFKTVSFYRRKRRKTRQMEWVSLDSSSVYRFDVSMLIYYFGLFHVRLRTLVILRRLLFIFGMLVFTSYLYEVFRLYYYNLLKLDFIQYHSRLVTFIQNVGHLNKISEMRESLLYTLILPSIYTIVIFLTMAHTLLISYNICKSLNWNDDGYFLGRFYREMPQRMTDEQATTDGIIVNANKNTTWEYTIYHNMKRRLKHLTSVHFWKFWWQECVCGWNPFVRFGISCCGYIMFAIWVAVRCVLFLVLLLLYATPAVAIFTGLAREAFTRTHATCKARICALFKLLSTTCGICILYLEMLTFTYLTVQLVTFLCIDVLRNVDDSLPYLILMASVVLYVEGSLTSLEDEYRQIKANIFDIVESIMSSSEGEKIVCAFRPFPQLIKYAKDKECKYLPKPIFDTICHHCLPLKKSVIKRMMSLAMSILVIGLIFRIVIRFRILGDFSKESESIITLLTVSIPRLLGFMKSEKAEELRVMQLKTKIESTLERLTIKLPQEDSVI